MKNENVLAEMEALFSALADKTRLRLLNLMRGGEVCVQHFTEVTGENQPKISRHLAYLRNAGIASIRRDGKWINYKIEFPQNQIVAQVLRQTLESLAVQREMLEDYEKLNAIVGFSSQFIGNAPQVFAKTNMNYQSEELEIFLL